MRSLLFALGFATLLPAAETPNLVVIFMDDMGYADISCFGAQGYATPNIDRLAREGRRFTNFHVAQAVCSASRAALLTGCYPNRIGIHGALGPKSTHGLHANEMTLAEVVKQKGYATAAVGKWHLGHRPSFLPTRHGFDEYYGLPYSNDMWPHHPEAKPGTYPPLPLLENESVIDAEVTPEDQKRLTSRYTERAVRFVERHKDRPFFLYLAHSMPHVPLFVSDSFAGRSGKGLYADVMLEIDASVGRILDTLDQHGLTEKTWVIFTSDNGPWLSYGDHAGSTGPLREGKGTAWEGGTRVSCLMRWPNRIPAGSTSDALFATIDLLPTIAGRLDAQLPGHPIDGRDVWPVIATDGPNPHEFYAWYYQNNQLQAVTSGDGRWKLVLPHGYRSLNGRPGGRNGIPAKYEQLKLTEPALYDLQTDIGESRDVAGQHPEVVTRLQELAGRMRAELGDSLHQRPRGSGTRDPGRE